MKYYFYLFWLVISTQVWFPVCAGETTASTFYLIRHAEKQLDVKKDPQLTDAGRQRAHKWAEVFQHIELDHVYSTDTARTRDTARPIADSQELPVELYSWRGMDFAAFADQHAGRSVLIVGHSNTSPAFSNALLGKERYPELDESVYGRLYIIDVNGAVRSGKMLTINP